MYKIKHVKYLQPEGHPSTSTFILDSVPNLHNEKQILMYPTFQTTKHVYLYFFFADMNLHGYYISISTQLVVYSPLPSPRFVGDKSLPVPSLFPPHVAFGHFKSFHDYRVTTPKEILVIMRPLLTLQCCIIWISYSPTLADTFYISVLLAPPQHHHHLAPNWRTCSCIGPCQIRFKPRPAQSHEYAREESFGINRVYSMPA